MEKWERELEENSAFNILKNMEKYYHRLFHDAGGSFGYCKSCDEDIGAFTYLVSPSYIDSLRKGTSSENTALPAKRGFECIYCEEDSKNNLVDIPYGNALGLYSFFGKNTPEGLIKLIDTWRIISNFPTRTTYKLPEGRELAEEYAVWDGLGDEEKDHQSANLLIEQWRRFSDKRQRINP